MEYKNHMFQIGIFFTGIDQPEKQGKKRGKEK
mgnify:CR=1 FL=1